MGTPAKAAGAVYAPRPGFAGLLGPRLQAGTIGLPLSDAERVRLHPYLTERILCRVPSLVRVASLAGAHYERLDGSGDSSVARSTVDHVAVALRSLARVGVSADRCSCWESSGS
jgi:hypothetical protein